MRLFTNRTNRDLLKRVREAKADKAAGWLPFGNDSKGRAVRVRFTSSDGLFERTVAARRSSLINIEQGE